MKPTEEFTQLRFHFTDPIQNDYEVIRPIVLFAQPVAARSDKTDIKRTTVGEKRVLCTSAQKYTLRGLVFD